MSDPLTHLDAALESSYRIERELREGAISVRPVSKLSPAIGRSTGFQNPP